jgi:hypothetical protein
MWSFPKVQDRKLDLVLLLEDDSILHIEIQSTHDGEIAYRMLDYYSLLKRRYKRPTRQVLLYVGRSRARKAVDTDPSVGGIARHCGTSTIGDETYERDHRH